MELRQKIADAIWLRLNDLTKLEAELAADAVLAIPEIAQALKLTMVKTMENRS